MIRVKDGFGKLIGTTAAGSAGRVLLSNGGDSEFLRSKTYINNTGEVDYYKKITITNSSTEGFVIWIHSRLQHYLLNSGANAMSTPMNVFWELGTNYNNSTTSRVINIKAVATASSAKVVLYALVKAYTYILIVSPGEINIEDSTKEDYDAITSSTSGWITCKTANWSDTNNTAGSTNSTSKMYLIGATTQGSSTQTYSNNKVYATDGVLYADSLRIGYDSTRNYIAFNGTTGDGPGSYNHTYVGENYTGASELSELVLFKGNDPSNGSGPDRIRHIAGRHLFQVYTSALSGSFETICTSTVPVNCLALNATDITTYNPILPSTTNTVNLGSSTLKWANVYATNFKGNADTATTATNIKQTATASNANYPLLLAPLGQTANTTGQAYFDSEVTLNPSTNILDKAKVYESLLEWGGYNVAGDVSPIDAAMSSEFAQNRLAFLNPDLITIEFTRDNGANWYTYPKTYTDAGTTDIVTTGYEFITNDQKQRLVTDGLAHTLWLGSRRGNQKSSDKLRITILGDGFGLFIKCKKILFNYCQAYGNGSYCLVEAAMANAPDTFNIVKLYNISGWTNWNSIPYVGHLGEWSNSNRAGYTRKLRLTFGVTGVTENYPTDIYINKLRIFGTDSYAGGNSLTLTGHLYSFDVNKNAAFPANVTATTFIGSLLGTATNATNVIVNQHTGNNIEYPLVWSNSTSASTTTANQLYKSYNHLTYNPNKQRVTASLFKGNLEGGYINLTTPAGSVPISVTTNTSGPYQVFARLMASGLLEGNSVSLTFGRTYDAYNCGYIGFLYNGNASTSNAVTIGLYGKDYILNVLGSGNVGIGTKFPRQALEVLGNIQICSSAVNKTPKLVLYEYCNGSNDWVSELISDYFGTNVCTTSGFTHGTFLKLGRQSFDNFIILNSSKTPIARISKEKGHWFDGDVTATNFIGPATHIKSGGRLTCTTTTDRESGLRFYQIFENGYPFGYGNVIQVNGANGVSQLAMEWYGTRLAYRSAPDSSTTFTDWATLITDKNYTSYTVKKDGTGASGTWGINITGNAAIATSLVSTDSRSIEDTPTTYNKGLYAAFKNNGVNAMSDGYSYYGLLHFRPYGSNTDFSGGYPYLLAFTENQHIWYRKAKNATEWNNWKLLAFLSDLSSYATTTYVDTAIANAQLDGSNVTIPVTDVKVKTSASSSAVTVINANKEAIIDLSTYAKLADLPKSLPLTPILTYDAISPIGAYAYENANGDASTNGFLFSNTSAAFGWGKSNCLVVLAAQAGKSTPTIFIKQYYLSWGDWYTLVHSGNVNQYAPKWDGTNARGTWNISISGKASGITGYTFKTLSAKSHSGWTNNTTDDKIIPTMSILAFWNGAHTSSGASNLTYCTKGAFGDAAVKGVTTSVTSGNTNLVTSGGVYSYINAYLPLAGGTLTGNLNFNSLIPITWTGGTYQLRINTVDDGITGTDVFQFLQSSDSGTNWKTLLSIRDEGTVNLTGGNIPDLSAYWLSPTIIQSDTLNQITDTSGGSPIAYTLISGNNQYTVFDKTITVGQNNKLFIDFRLFNMTLSLISGYAPAQANEWSILLTPTYYIYLNGILYKMVSGQGYTLDTNANNNSIRIEIKISYPQLITGGVFLVPNNASYYKSENNFSIQLNGSIWVGYEECANSNVYNLAVSIVNKEGFLICDTVKTNITYSNSDMFFIKRGSKCFKITNDGVELSLDEGINWKLLQLLN